MQNLARTLGLTLTVLAFLATSSMAGAEEFSLSSLASVLGSSDRDAVVTGTVKSINSPDSLFTIQVEKKGDVEFRVSPQTRFDSEMLGGIVGRQESAGLESLKTGNTVKVRYLTLPPEKPVAAQVDIQQ